MELIQVGKNTYYLDNPTNIGIYLVNDKDVYLIDSGNSKDTGKKILKILNEHNWNVVGIINTHSHADHIGGNNVIQTRTNCKIFNNNIENSFANNPILEPSLIYGGYPFKDLLNRTLLAKESNSTLLNNSSINLFDVIELKGHSYNMIGLKTKDNIYFLGDSLFSEETINKYHIFYIYSVKEFLNTLDKLNNLDGDLYILSHCKPTKDLKELIKINKDKVVEIINKIYNLCSNKITFEDILQKIFTDYNINMNDNQYFLIGSTIKAYLTYLYDEGKISYTFLENKMYWYQLNDIKC